MITRKDILEDAMMAPGVIDNAEARADAVRRINHTLATVSEKHSWRSLRKSMEVSLSAQATTAGQEGHWLPLDLAGIDAVQNKDNGEWFINRDLHSMDMEELGMPRFSTYSPRLSPLFWADDAIIDRGSDTFTSTLLDADGGDYTGEWIRLGDDPQAYKLIGSRQINRKYWGDSLDYVNLVVRPESQKKIVFRTTHDALLLSGTAVIHYWTYHPLLYRDSDEFLLPNPRWFMLYMMREARGVLSRRSRDPINAEIEAEWGEVLRLNPSFTAPTNPRGRLGNVLDPANIRYTKRGSGGTWSRK